MRSLGAREFDGLRVEALLIRVEPEIELPALLARPREGERPRVALLVGPQGKLELLSRRRAWIEALSEQGRACLLVDLRYTGELDRASAWRELYGRFFGRDEGVLQVQDLRRVLDALTEIEDLDPSRPLLLGFGSTGATALFAAAVDSRFGAVIAPALGPGYRDSPRRPLLSRVLLHGDLEDAATLLAARPALLGGVADPLAERLRPGEWTRAEGGPISPAAFHRWLQSLEERR